MQNKTRNELLHPEMMFNEIDFKKIFIIILHYKWIILGMTLLSFSLGLYYVSNIAPKYVSNALIQVDNQLGSANNMQQMLGNMNNVFSSTSQASPADIEIALIKSQFILQSVVEKLKLNIVASARYFPVIGKIIASKYKKNEISPPLFGWSQFAWGGESIHVARLEVDNSFIGIAFNLRADGYNQYSLYTQDGHLILNGKVGELASTKLGTEPKLKLLISQLKANTGTYFSILQKNNEDAIRQIAQNLSIIDLGNKDKTKTGVLQISFQHTQPAFIPQVINAIIEYAIQKNIEKKSAEASKTLDFLNRQLPDVRKNLETAETNLNEYRAKNGTIDISQEAKIMLTKLSAIEQSIAEVRLKRVELLQELTPQHPFIISLEHKQLQLQKEITNLENKIKRVPKTDQHAMNLERDVKVKDQLYLLLLNKIQQLQVLKAGTLSDIRILNLATKPIIPLPQHKSFILMVSLILGFFSSIIVLFIREMLRRGIENPELVEAHLGIPIFAIIPHSRRQKQLTREVQNLSINSSSKLLAKNIPKDIAVEGVRSLRTMLQFSLEQANNNIISILGATASIGKSFVSTNLAQVLVDSNKKILLIDCDMRKGNINRCLGQKKSPGFAELLTHRIELEQAISQIDNSFDFIATGEYPSNPSELLTGDKVKKVLAHLSAVYDLIIIDTPPILAVTDGVIIAKYAAINLMVIGCGTDQLQELDLMVKRVKRNGININGLVFNNKSQTKQAYGQYNYYYAYEAE